MISRPSLPIYVSGECEVDLDRRELRVLGTPALLGGRAFEIVELLVQSAGQLISKDELLGRVWPGAIILENTLHVHISSVRRALGPYRKLLKTESGRGYRLLGQWTPVSPRASATAISIPLITASQGLSLGNLPKSPADLIGTSEAEQLVTDLLSASRLVTLTGTGGIGKTSLAIKAASGLINWFDDGVWLVELASLSDPSLVSSAVTAALGLRLGGGEISADVVARAIGERKLLVILDNCEHVIEAAAGLAESIFRLCPRVTLLATSREGLRIGGEQVYRVAPLDVPPPHQEKPDELLRHSSIELFVHRLRSSDPTFVPSQSGLVAAAAICRRLDGIPLAIEFAASRAATLGLPQVVEMLDDRFHLLTLGRRTALPKHQTLRATLDWSYRLLPGEEQMLLRHLSVFRAGFTIDAATAVLAESAFDRASTTEGIADLVEKSLIVRVASSERSRWYLLDTIRTYALEKLAEHGELGNATRNHALYFQKLFGDGVHGSVSRLSEDDWTRRVREIDNVRSAIDWCFSNNLGKTVGASLTAAYAPVWLHLSLMQECRDRSKRALLELDNAPANPAGLQMWLQIALAASLFDTMGSARQASDLLATALEAAETLGDMDAQAAALASLVSNFIFQDELQKAHAAAERLTRIATRIGDPAVERIAERQMGTSLLMLGKPRDAQQLFDRFLEDQSSAEQSHLLWHPANHRATARALLSWALLLRGFPLKANDQAQASLEELKSSDHPLLLCRILYFGFCRVAVGAGDLRAAESSIARLNDVAARLNGQFWQTAGRLLLGKMLVDRGDFAGGVEILRQALGACNDTGWRMSNSEFKGALAVGLAGLEQLDTALAAVNEGLAAASRHRDRPDLYYAETLRIKGDILLKQGDASGAEGCFVEALDVARQQDALLWELRTALSLTKAQSIDGRIDGKRELLAAVYGRFTEGFMTPDLVAARSLLETLK